MPLAANEIWEVWSHENEENTSSSLPPTFEDLRSHLKLKGIILLCWRFPSITDHDTLYHNDHDEKGLFLPYNVINRVAYGRFLTESAIG